jgi:hypothetical protein
MELDFYIYVESQQGVEKRGYVLLTPHTSPGHTGQKKCCRFQFARTQSRTFEIVSTWYLQSLLKFCIYENER